MTHSPALDKPGVRLMLNKVPEVTMWFWVIKILCTTVGESFADWINMTLGVGPGEHRGASSPSSSSSSWRADGLRQYVPFPTG